MSISVTATLEKELAWFQEVLDARIQIYFERDCPYNAITDISPPDLVTDESSYANLIKTNSFGFDERAILVLSLIPHIKPECLDILLTKNEITDRRFTEFGGYTGDTRSSFLPTCQTAVFIIAGDALNKRLETLEIFRGDRFPTLKSLLRVEEMGTHEPILSARFSASAQLLDQLSSS